jgi:hypothetical protein
MVMDLLEKASIVFCYRLDDKTAIGVHSHMGEEHAFRIKWPARFHADAAIAYHFTGVIIDAIRAGELD